MRPFWQSLRKNLLAISLSLFLFANVQPLRAQSAPLLTVEARSRIEEIVQSALSITGVPSASVAVVRDGKVVYVEASGYARLDPKSVAKPEMRHSIGSISKQFTSAAILLLQEQGKLSLDDKVSKWVPGLT